MVAVEADIFAEVLVDKPQADEVGWTDAGWCE